jgi:glutathione S-transferase
MSHTTQPKQTQHHIGTTGDKEGLKDQQHHQTKEKECFGKEPCPTTGATNKGTQQMTEQHHDQGTSSSKYDINEAEQHKRIQKGTEAGAQPLTGMAAAHAYRQEMGHFPKIHYFPINGRGDLIKVLFEDAGKPYEYVTHAVGKHRFTLTMLPFGQLPMMTEPDGYPLCQTGTIIRYVAKQQNQYPSNDRDAAHAEMVVDQCMDIMNHYFSFLHGKKTKEQLAGYLTTQWGYMECILNCSEKNHKSPWMTSVFCFADLILWHVVHSLKVFQGDLPTKLAAHYNRVCSRRNIQEYVASNRFVPACLEPCKTEITEHHEAAPMAI